MDLVADGVNLSKAGKDNTYISTGEGCVQGRVGDGLALNVFDGVGNSGTHRKEGETDLKDHHVVGMLN